MRILSVEGPVYALISRFWDMVKLNFMWLLFSLPIVTIGPSTIAAYTVTLKMVKDEEEGIVSPFLKAFLANLKQGIPLGGVHLSVAYFFYLNIEFLVKVNDGPVFFLIAAMVIGFFGLLYLTYAFPLSARYQNTLANTLRISAAIAMKYFVTTLMLWTVLALLMFLFSYNSILTYMGVLIGPACIFLTISGFAVRLFDDIGKDAHQ